MSVSAFSFCSPDVKDKTSKDEAQGQNEQQVDKSDIHKMEDYQQDDSHGHDTQAKVRG
jgi:hypothetical protein